MLSARNAEVRVEVPAISATALTKSFGRIHVLRGVEMEVRWGDIFVLFGPNGAGKTTLLRVLATLTNPTSGKLQIAGIDPRRDPNSVRRLLGVVLHQTFLYDDLTVEENLRFYGRMFGVAELDSRIKEVLVRVGLEHRRNSTVRTLSRGMQQRATIARALLHNPRILLLDEPDTGLDQEAVKMLQDVITERTEPPRAVVMTTHNLERGLAMAQRLAIIVKGRIVYQAAKDSFATERFADVYAECVGGVK